MIYLSYQLQTCCHERWSLEKQKMKAIKIIFEKNNIKGKATFLWFDLFL